MRCVVEYENGNINEFLVDGWAKDAIDDIINEMPRTVRAWIYMDEFEERWDPDSYPDWEKWKTRRLYRFYGPAGSGVMRLPWLPVDEWKAMVARDLPLTYNATDTWDVEPVKSVYRDETVCHTDEELAEAIAGPSAVRKAPARRKTASKNPSRKGGNDGKTASARRTTAKRTPARKPTTRRKTTGARR